MKWSNELETVTVAERKHHAVHLGQPLFRQRLANIHALRRKGFSTRTASLVDLQGIDVMLIGSVQNKRSVYFDLLDAASSVGDIYDELRIFGPNRLDKRCKVLLRLVQRIDTPYAPSANTAQPRLRPHLGLLSRCWR